MLRSLLWLSVAFGGEIALASLSGTQPFQGCRMFRALCQSSRFASTLCFECGTLSAFGKNGFRDSGGGSSKVSSFRSGDARTFYRAATTLMMKRQLGRNRFRDLIRGKNQPRTTGAFLLFVDPFEGDTAPASWSSLHPQAPSSLRRKEPCHFRILSGEFRIFGNEFDRCFGCSLFKGAGDENVNQQFLVFYWTR
ncbi:hypothetical protein BH11ARM1_BH11ARM1_01840 [soil metagenome]